MWHGHLRHINTKKHDFELLKLDKTSVHVALYCAGPKTREWEKAGMNQMLTKNATKTVQAKRAAFIVFDLRNGRKLSFKVGFRILDAVTTLVSFSIPRIDKCAESLVKATISPHIGH